MTNPNKDYSAMSNGELAYHLQNFSDKNQGGNSDYGMAIICERTAARLRAMDELIERFPEINPSNYDHDDVCRLNDWGVELVLSWPVPPTHEKG